MFQMGRLVLTASIAGFVLGLMVIIPGTKLLGSFELLRV